VLLTIEVLLDVTICHFMSSRTTRRWRQNDFS